MNEAVISVDDLHKALTPLFEKYEFARGLYQENDGLSVTSNPKQTMAEPIPFKRGVVISVLKDGLFYEASTSLSQLSDVTRLVKGLEKSMAERSLQGSKLSLIKEETHQESFQGELGSDLALSEKIKIAKDMVTHIQSLDKSVVMAQARYKQVKNREYYVSAKKKLSQEMSRFEAIFIAILKDDASGQTSQVYDGYGLQGGWEHVRPNEELLTKMISDGKKLLNAPRLKPGTYDCIFSPSVSGILAHEAFGHGTEADTMVKNRAKGSHYMNKRVASDKVKLYDSPALEGEAASYFFDHEGELARTTTIVEGGILTQPMTDHRSASVLKVKRSPNGRRESYDHKIYTRMTNTYFMPGDDKLAEMIASIDNGYFIDRATNGMEDPKSWGIQLEALYAEKIKDGKLTGEVFTPVIVTGYVPDILGSISMVSDDLEIGGLGMCGKGYKEWVKVTDGGPYLKLRARLA